MIGPASSHPDPPWRVSPPLHWRSPRVSGSTFGCSATRQAKGRWAGAIHPVSLSSVSQIKRPSDDHGCSERRRHLELPGLLAVLRGSLQRHRFLVAAVDEAGASFHRSALQPEEVSDRLMSTLPGVAMSCHQLPPRPFQRLPKG
jgi:hypothetical protein